MNQPCTPTATGLAALMACVIAAPWGERGAFAAGESAQAFLQEAASAGQMEVELGQLAETRAARSEVKELASRMVTDRSTTNAELRTLANTKNIPLSVGLDRQDRTRYDRLAELAGEAFERAYLREMLTDHERDVAEFREASQSSEDADVRAFAARTLPILEDHLDRAHRIASGQKGRAAPGVQPRADIP